MNLSELSLRRPVTVWMIIVAMLIFGFVSFPKMAVDLYPELNLPVAVVVTSVDGGTPAEVEKLVTKPIEEALASVSNIDQISSNSVGGASQVIVQFNWGTDLDQATLDMRDKVDLIRGMLPDSANTPQILRFDPNAQPVVTLALTGSEDTANLKSVADNMIKPRLERIDGVASVGVIGGQDRLVEVMLDPLKLETYGITVDQIRQSLASSNLSGSAGSVKLGDEKLSIRVQGEFKDIESIAETPLSMPGGSIPLKDVAVVTDKLADITQLTYLNGEPSLGLSITKASGGNTVQVAEMVHKEIEKLGTDLPDDLKLTVIVDTSKYIKDSINTVAEHAVLGGLFAILVLYLFLNSARSTLVVSIVIPISIVATFSMMYFSGQTINLISLSGLLLGLGSLVDFAVVILENIFRLRQQGKGMLEAAKEGSKQVGNAVMASALAQIVVFVPIIFVDGIAAELFGPLALTVIFSHIAALVVSIMLVPMLSSRWIKTVPDESIYHSGTYKGRNPVIWFNIGFEKLSKTYGNLLSWALKKRKTVFAWTVALFVGAVGLMPMVGMEFIPKMDQGQLSVSIKMPNGTVLEQTADVVSQVEAVVKDIPELDKVYTSIGSSGGPAALSTGVSNRAQLDVMLVDLQERTRSTEQVMMELREKLNFIPDAEINVTEAQEGGGMTGSPLQLNLRGDNLEVLKDIADIIVAEVEQVEGTFNVKTSLDSTGQEFQIVVDPKRLSQYGLTTGQVLNSVRTAFDGQKVTQYRTGDDEIDVKLKLPAEFKQDVTYLERLRITTPQGASVALSSVASIVKEDVPQTIRRANQTREVQITADIAGRDLGSITRDVEEKLNRLNLPEGYQLQYGGQNQQMTDSFMKLGLAMLLAIVFVYMVMAAQFESLFSPFIIMFSIPPTFIGVVVGLAVTGHSLSVMAIIGYILLIGIVVNNAIVLIDYINQLRQQGMERDQAVLEAGPVRLRPILMTTLSTILAILPLAFGGGSGNEGQAPMAIVVAFGLSFSTLITLILIPVVYTWFDDIGLKWRNRKNRKKKADSVEQNVQL
ncbi:efflux RND transporter permease subunit [Ammoniphilus sp. CFH 90114]|uniref:efflux RND transporter permease subunit n=1 Tax=Ammoniphilus sp. CFH 90114 TaxID=2493665 RepID=UPI00100E865F|nr:efflux RND transporter permease subunit [Ammoniphilus sp. CFH 90114]RXT15260.1 efflux RND transporter permease subunit [Ammoniphilus sp. CFH 90114]